MAASKLGDAFFLSSSVGAMIGPVLTLELQQASRRGRLRTLCFWYSGWLVLQVARFNDGTRRLTHITEITGMEDDVVSMQDVFVFDKQGVSPDGKVLGQFLTTGIRPKFVDKLVASGISLPTNFFQSSVKLWN